jgi:hypothetical protein
MSDRHNLPRRRTASVLAQLAVLAIVTGLGTTDGFASQSAGQLRRSVLALDRGIITTPVIARKAAKPADAAPVTPPPSATPPYPKVDPDGPRHTLQDCMAIWDKATHMTKAEWRATCKRSIREAEKYRTR